MALSSFRFRRALALSSALLKHQSSPSATYSSSIFRPSEARILSTSLGSPCFPLHHLNQCLSFRSSSLSSERRSDSGDGKISPDEILFEGCDYNHWLITMDFPKDPKPTPEQMVETYVETLAKVVGSREEAMKRMYACSTTTYNGFQAVMTEEMSEKFRGLPGVVFILPDSYIDPVNKEYGGDKYEMGKITPRPPPVQYGRQGRYGDRNRNYDRPRYDRPRDSMPMQQGNPPYERQGPAQSDGRNYGSQHHLNPTGQQGSLSYERQPPMQGHGTSYPPQQNFQQTGQQGGPMYDQGFAQGDTRNIQQSYSQVGGHGFSPSSGRRDFAPGVRDSFQVERSPTQSYQRDFSQGERGSFGSQGQGGLPQGQWGVQTDAGSFNGRDYQQGPSADYGQYHKPGEGQSFQNRGNAPEELSNFNSPGHVGKGQEQY